MKRSNILKVKAFPMEISKRNMEEKHEYFLKFWSRNKCTLVVINTITLRVFSITFQYAS